MINSCLERSFYFKVLIKKLFKNNSYIIDFHNLFRFYRFSYDLETFFQRQGHLNVRPGLVIGNGGLFGRNMKKILRSPLIPLLDGGKDQIPVLAITDFLRCMELLIRSNDYPLVQNLFNENLSSLKNLTQKINSLANHRVLYVSIPTAMAVKLLEFLKSVGLPLPVNVDNIRAVKSNEKQILILS